MNKKEMGNWGKKKRGKWRNFKILWDMKKNILKFRSEKSSAEIQNKSVSYDKKLNFCCFWKWKHLKKLKNFTE